MWDGNAERGFGGRPGGVEPGRDLRDLVELPRGRPRRRRTGAERGGTGVGGETTESGTGGKLAWNGAGVTGRGEVKGVSNRPDSGTDMAMGSVLCCGAGRIGCSDGWSGG